jgi:hypothetical protein
MLNLIGGELAREGGDADLGEGVNYSRRGCREERGQSCVSRAKYALCTQDAQKTGQGGDENFADEGTSSLPGDMMEFKRTRFGDTLPIILSPSLLGI